MPEVIVALDKPSAREALALVDRLGPVGGFYKVGLELFSHGGPDVVREIRKRGKRVFLDLKLHDIPATVAGAVRAAIDLDVELLTVHASGGRGMLEAGQEATEGRVSLLGVTVLTSLTAADVEAVWGREINSIREEVQRLAEMAVGVGLAGVVASALEASWIRRQLDSDFLIVTPGIRPPGDRAGDQRRVVTPTAAVESGSDYLVVGRSVTMADDPIGALEAMVDEVERTARPAQP